jgi:hypothetical protein
MYCWILCTGTETNPWIENLPTENPVPFGLTMHKVTERKQDVLTPPKHLIFSKLVSSSFNYNLLKFVHLNISATESYRSNLTTINSTVKSLRVSNIKSPLNLQTQIRRPAPLIHVILRHTLLTFLVRFRLGPCHVQIDVLINGRRQAQQYRQKITYL